MMMFLAIDDNLGEEIRSLKKIIGSSDSIEITILESLDLYSSFEL